MKVLFAGGGTGGHLYPAVAMAAELGKLVPGIRIAFAGTSTGIEATEVPRLGYPLHIIPVRGFRRGRSVAAMISNFGVLFDFVASLGRAIALIGNENPDVVVGTGGFVSAPVLFAAQLMQRRTLVQEQNAFPGVTTKLLARFADEVHLSFDDARRYFSSSGGLFVTGNPARQFPVESADAARRRFGLVKKLPTLLVFGGSRGARAINTAVLRSLARLTASTNLIWQTGKLEYERIRGDIPLSPNLWVGPYIEDMGSAYNAADLVLCRAGASSIAELTNAGKPSVLVPYPYATGDHQRFNAQALVQAGAAIMIDDAAVGNASTMEQVFALLHDPDTLTRMAAAAVSLAYPDAAAALARRILALAEQH